MNKIISTLSMITLATQNPIDLITIANPLEDWTFNKFEANA